MNEIVLPKKCFLIIAIISAIIMPLSGLLLGGLLMGKKYKKEGIILIIISIVMILLGIVIIYTNALNLGSESVGSILNEGQILPTSI